MKLSTIPNMPANFELILFGDDQEGNRAKARERFEETIDHIRSKPYRYAIHMGDTCDTFWCDDKRYDPDITKSPPLEQLKNEVEQLAPLAKTGRLLSILEGNHERALSFKVGNFSGMLAEQLRSIKQGSRYPIEGTFTNKIEFLGKDGRTMFKGFFTHGRRTISSISPDPHRKKANLQIRLRTLLERKAGDCIVMVRGHSHIVLVTPPIPTLFISSEKGKLKQHYTTPGSGATSNYIPPEHRFFGCSGSFLRSQVDGISTYAETGEYDPVELGYLKGIVHDSKFVDLQEVKI